MLTRRQFGLAGVAALAARTAHAEDAREAGRAFLLRVPSVDIHSHAGRFFVGDHPPATRFVQRLERPFPFVARDAIGASGISAVTLAAVADLSLLDSVAGEIRADGPYRPGEALAEYRRQLDALRAMAGRGRLRQARTQDDVYAAHRSREAACIFSIEGGDFIEDRPHRIRAAYQAGIRSVGLIHYRANQIGDTQTSPPVHDGISALGRTLVRTLEREGMLLDLSHASLATTRAVAELSTRPMLLSHSNLKLGELDHPRLVTVEHARLVTSRGGVIGLLPAGAGQGDLRAFVDNVLRSVELLGIDHVGIGTDMDFSFRSALPVYGDWPLLVGALLARGLGESDVARIIGGNFLRVFALARPQRGSS